MAEIILDDLAEKVSHQKAKSQSITSEFVGEVLSYDPETGVFRWLKSLSRSIRVGDIAGSVNGRGRHVIKIRGRAYYSHRIAWLMKTGDWPLDQIDHVDGNPLNNKMSNLRECTHAENHQNRALPLNNKSGHIGVFWNKARGKWSAQIGHNFKDQFLGHFSRKEDAVAAYVKAKKDLHLFNPSVPQRSSGASL